MPGGGLAARHPSQTPAGPGAGHRRAHGDRLHGTRLGALIELARILASSVVPPPVAFVGFGAEGLTLGAAAEDRTAVDDASTAPPR